MFADNFFEEANKQSQHDEGRAFIEARREVGDAGSGIKRIVRFQLNSHGNSCWCGVPAAAAAANKQGALSCCKAAQIITARSNPERCPLGVGRLAHVAAPSSPQRPGLCWQRVAQRSANGKRVAAEAAAAAAFAGFSRDCEMLSASTDPRVVSGLACGHPRAPLGEHLSTVAATAC